MFELDQAAVTAALQELAVEDEAGIDRAVDATAERAHGRPVHEVEMMLRRRLRHEGIDLGDDTARIAQQIAEAVGPRTSSRAPTRWTSG